MKHMRLSPRSLIVVTGSLLSGSAAHTAFERLPVEWAQPSGVGTLIGIAAGLWAAEKLDGLITPDSTDTDKE
ncbi:hypothetical protein [Streptomyces sp. NBC_00391]|uniref:hypothetical protein n=1 Tax=Streptomyces sp. NBC_00391 TaxID=2903647 RepID=UPI002E1D5E34